MDKRSLKPTVLIFLLITLILLIRIFLPSELHPPVAAQRPVITRIHDVELTDNYHWLKDPARNDPEVLEYLDQENAYADYILKDSKKLQKQIFSEISRRIKKEDSSFPVKIGDYYYYEREEINKDYKIYCRKFKELSAPEEIYLDENILATSHDFFDIYQIMVSPDHRFCAYNYDINGSEEFLLVIKDLESDQLLPEIIINTADIVWAEDSHTLFYLNNDKTGRSNRLFRHVLHTSINEDELLYQENDAAFYLSLSKSRSRQYIFLGSFSKTTSEIRFLNSFTPSNSFTLILPRQQNHMYSVQHKDDDFYLLTNFQHPDNYKIIKTKINYTESHAWTTLLDQSSSVIIDFELFNDFIAVEERKDGNPVIRIINFADSSDYYLNLKESSSSVNIAYNPDFYTSSLRFRYESFTIPPCLYEYDLKEKNTILLKQDEVEGEYDPDIYHSRQYYACADDSIMIPVMLLYNRNLISADKPNPLLLNAYGAYGDSYDPYFSISRLSLLDRGIIYAVARVRGGGEYGRKWYDDGKMMSKKNSFTDFIACAEFLIGQGWTDSNNLIIEGGSAGGLLIGAVLNMRPDLFCGAVADVPFVDMINSMLDSTLSATVTEYEEWGNPNIPEEFYYMLSYSPYENISQQEYPHILAISAFYDTRVNYWEPAKWIARLRNLTTDDNLILLKTDMKAGHAGASGRFGFYREVAFKYAFILHILGIE